MSLASDLDDPTKTCILLTKSSSSPGNSRPGKVKERTSTGRKREHAYSIQLEAYEIAWGRCLERVRAIIRDLQTPIVSDVKTSIYDAYSKDILPGLPSTELPVVAVSASAGGLSVIPDVVTTLESRRKGEDPGRSRRSTKGKGRMAQEECDELEQGQCLVTHFHQADCVNLASAMRAIITGFMERQEEGGEDELVIQLPSGARQRSAASLAPYDINSLKAWYNALSQLNGWRPQLVIVLHDFEQLDPNVMQDVFYICSRHIPQLPLVFLLDSSAPSTMAHLHAAYSRSIVALLRVCIHAAPSGLDLVNTLIEKTFFDPDFEPDISLGPAALEFLAEFASRHTSSLDATLTILQIIHIRHFEAPLTSFVHGFASDASLREAATRIRQTSLFPLVDQLLVKLWSEKAPNEPPKDIPEYLIDVDWDDLPLEGLLSLLNSARDDFRKRAAHMRLGYQVIRILKRFMQSQGYKPSASTTGQEDSELTFMGRMVRGRVGRDVKHLALMVRKLHDNQLDALVGEIYGLFYRLQSAKLRQSETETREFLVQARGSIAAQNTSMAEEPTVVKKASTVASSVSEWFASYVENRLAPLDQQPLWELWSTGIGLFPSELINPAPRATIVNALLCPSDVVQAHRTLYLSSDADTEKTTDDEPANEIPELWELSDTNILFRRYMEAGRLINIYDLYESFAVVLDTQREKHARAVKPKRWGKGKKKAAEADDELDDEDEEENWAREVHARFMRAVHELDYMGFIKHTGRKADHVFKTVYDVPD